MQLLEQIATQGLGYTLFVISVGVIVYLNRKVEQKEKTIEELQEKRLQDSNLYTQNFTSVAREMVAANKDAVNATAILQKSIDSITQILQNVVQTMRNK